MPTADQIASENPDVAQFFRAQGADAERARIQAVEGQFIPGHEVVINTLKFDGKSTADDVAQAILAAEKTTRTTYATAMASDAPTPLPLAPAPAIEDKPLSRLEIHQKTMAHIAAKLSKPTVFHSSALINICARQRYEFFLFL